MGSIDSVPYYSSFILFRRKYHRSEVYMHGSYDICSIMHPHWSSSVRRQGETNMYNFLSVRQSRCSLMMLF